MRKGEQIFNRAEIEKPGESHDIHKRLNGVYDESSVRKFEDMAILKPKRILVVDDDHCVREVLSRLLIALKFKVKSVDNAYDALDLFINEGFELVLTDIQMPGMDGWELAFNIKKISTETPVILITGMEKHEVEERMQNGHANFIQTNYYQTPSGNSE